jgi:hypothetical protein
MKYLENDDYEFIPDDKNNDNWQVRFLSGDYLETVIQYGTIRMQDGEQMSFDFNLVSSPIEDLDVDNTEFQIHAGDILISIIEDAIENQATDIRLNEVKS